MIPIIENITQPSDTPLGQPVAIFCLVTGYPLPNITWQRDGNSISSSETERVNILRFRTNEDDLTEDLLQVDLLDEAYINTTMGELGVVGVLSVERVVRGDSGTYSCMATNELPQTRSISTTSGSVPLLVLGKSICICDSRG